MCVPLFNRTGERDCSSDVFDAVRHDTEKLYAALAPWRCTRAIVMLLRFAPLLACFYLMALATPPVHDSTDSLARLMLFLCALGCTIVLAAYVLYDVLVAACECCLLVWRNCCVPTWTGCVECGTDCAYGVGIV